MSYHGREGGVEPSLGAMVAKAYKQATRDALQRCLDAPRADHWRAAAKAAWTDLKLTTADCMWLLDKAKEAPPTPWEAEGL